MKNVKPVSVLTSMPFHHDTSYKALLWIDTSQFSDGIPEAQV